jgi:hypothetical protein
MAVLAVGLAGLGMAGGRAVGLRAAGAVGRDEATESSRTGQVAQMAVASAWSSVLSAKKGS